MNFFKKKKTEDNFENFPPIGGLMVSKMVFDKNIKPRFLYREKRTRPEDSGWRIFTGFESEEYTNDSNNVGIYNPLTLLKIEPSLKNILLKGIGSVYERQDDNSEWYKVTDYDLDDDFMTSHKLTENWTIEINNLFERTIEENGDLFYTTGDKSIRIVIWNEENKTKETLYAEQNEIIENRDQSKVKTLQKFSFSNEIVTRIGYSVKEHDENKEYTVIHGFSNVDNQTIQFAIYFDEEEEINWAIETWNNINFAL